MSTKPESPAPKVRIGVAVEAELREKLFDYAWGTRRSLTSVVVEALEEYVERNKDKIQEKKL